MNNLPSYMDNSKKSSICVIWVLEDRVWYRKLSEKYRLKMSQIYQQA